MRPKNTAVCTPQRNEAKALTRRALWLALLLAPGGAGAAGAAGDLLDPPQGQFSDEWYAVYFQGQHSGWLHSSASRHGDEIHTRDECELTVRRGEIALQLGFTLAGRESIDGRPLAFETVSRIASVPITMRGTVREGRVHVVTEQFGLRRSATYDLPPDARMAWGAFRDMYRAGLTPGRRYTIHLYDPTTNPGGALETQIEVQARETVRLPDGRSVEATRVLQTVRLAGLETETLVWLDDRATPVRTRTELLGFRIEFVRCNQALAQAGTAGAEIMLNTFIDAGRAIPYERARRIVYRLAGRDGLPADRIPVLSAGSQRVLRRDAAGVEVLVARQPGPAQPTPIPQRGMQRYLASTAMANLEDEAIREMAAHARGADAQADPGALAARLCRYVADAIADKSLDVGFATASEVARRLEGDCSEHAVLLAALGRACDIPTRVVAGVVYLPHYQGRRDTFGFHMWTQFYIAGRWVDFDPALGETECTPRRIAFAASDLSEDSLATMVLRLADVIGNLRIEVEHIDSDDAG